MDNDEFLILRTGEAIGLVTPGEALEAIEDAWRDYGAARDVLSSPPAMALRGGGTRFKVKGAVLPEANLAGFRLIADGPSQTREWCWLAEAESGRPLALVEAWWLHNLRTAATGALAAKLLAPPGATRAALVGAGRIAAHLPGALAAALPGITDLHVAARRPEAVAEFCASAGQGLAMALHPAASVEEAVAGADIVITITTATAPVLQAAWLKPGATVIGLGDEELAPDLFGWANRFVVDELSFALTCGSLGAWVSGGAVTADALARRLDADIGEVAAGQKAGRQADGENVLAIIQGMAIGDLALSALAWRKARIRRLGHRVALGGDSGGPRPRGPTPRRSRMLR
jgi:ornithine cyclodeaminase